METRLWSLVLEFRVSINDTVHIPYISVLNYNIITYIIQYTFTNAVNKVVACDVSII